MKIVIIEDEVKTARALAAIITTVEPGAEIVASLQSVRASVDWFSAGMRSDLVFMDIQLADGLCFDIFRETTVPSPVVFCTAYDEYAIEGFKANGIDYILKPFSEATLVAAFQKWKDFRTHFAAAASDAQSAAPAADQPAGPDPAAAHSGATPAVPPEEFRHLLQSLTTLQGKNSFLVFKNNKYIVVPTDNIAFFYIKGELPVLYTFDNKEYFVNQSLDTLESVLPAGKFFRTSRQYLVHFPAVKEIEHYFARKLLVHLTVNTPEKVIISKEKSVAFLHWMDNR
jgi:DNA-binding LytR/AlgR family response regulator